MYNSLIAPTYVNRSSILSISLIFKYISYVIGLLIAIISLFIYLESFCKFVNLEYYYRKTGYFQWIYHLGDTYFGGFIFFYFPIMIFLSLFYYNVYYSFWLVFVRFLILEIISSIIFIFFMNIVYSVYLNTEFHKEVVKICLYKSCLKNMHKYNYQYLSWHIENDDLEISLMEDGKIKEHFKAFCNSKAWNKKYADDNNIINGYVEFVKSFIKLKSDDLKTVTIKELFEDYKLSINDLKRVFQNIENTKLMFKRALDNLFEKISNPKNEIDLEFFKTVLVNIKNNKEFNINYLKYIIENIKNNQNEDVKQLLKILETSVGSLTNQPDLHGQDLKICVVRDLLKIKKNEEILNNEKLLQLLTDLKEKPDYNLLNIDLLKNIITKKDEKDESLIQLIKMLEHVRSELGLSEPKLRKMEGVISAVSVLLDLKDNEFLVLMVLLNHLSDNIYKNDEGVSSELQYHMKRFMSFGLREMLEILNNNKTTYYLFVFILVFPVICFYLYMSYIFFTYESISVYADRNYDTWSNIKINLSKAKDGEYILYITDKDLYFTYKIGSNNCISIIVQDGKVISYKVYNNGKEADFIKLKNCSIYGVSSNGELIYEMNLEK